MPMANDPNNKYRTGGGFGGAFSGGTARSADSAPSSGATRGALQGTSIPSANTGSRNPRLALRARQRAGNTPMVTSGSGLAGGIAPRMGRGLSPAAQAKFEAYRVGPSGIGQRQMLEQQTAGFGTAADIVAQQNAALQPDMSGPSMAPGVERIGQGNSGVFVNRNPGQGFGKALYADSAYRATGAGFGGRGGIAYAQGSGPFGRTPDEQAAIEARVAEYQRATNLIRGMRDAPSERDKLMGQANQSVGLNQGIGAFINQAAQRNYARDRLKELDANDIATQKNATEQAKLARQITQDDIQNQLALAGLDKGRFGARSFTTTSPDGLESDGVMIIDQHTGQYRVADTADAGPQLSPDQAMAEAKRLADEAAAGISNWFTSDKDIFGGMTKAQWIQNKAKELAGGGQQAQAAKPVTATNPRTGEKIQWDGQQWVPVQ